MQPGEGALDHPTRAPEPAPVRLAAPGELGGNATPVEGVTMRLRVVAAVALNEARLAPGTTGTPAERRDGVDEGQQLRDVVPVRGGQNRGERNALRFREEVVLAARLTAIGWVRSSFFPPRSARSEALSTIARSRSSWPRSRRAANSVACSFFQTPARCQRARRLQHALPEPQPISLGSMFQGIPLRSTNRIPVNAARSGIGFRPAYRRRRDGRFGMRGAIWAHKASSTSVMRDRLTLGHATVPSPFSEYKGQVS
jgi:hypothetical protein